MPASLFNLGFDHRSFFFVYFLEQPLKAGPLAPSLIQAGFHHAVCDHPIYVAYLNQHYSFFHPISPGKSPFDRINNMPQDYAKNAIE